MERYDDDLLLIERSQNDKEVYGLLYQKYVQRVKGYMLRRVGRKETAEDFTQDTFLHAFAHLSHYRHHGGSYLNYLFTIAHNICVNYYRKKKESAFEGADQIPDEKGEKEAQARTIRFDTQQVWSAASDIAPVHRHILSLKYQEGQSVKEIAHALHKTENAIKLGLSRGRKKLAAHPALRHMHYTIGTFRAVRQQSFRFIARVRER
ncbi:sigma-70 family RNA polymerase sigma factor [Candidatus Azambacteria bacterium]|nr:sigma-70 family RNA polymerase sigma factor [Candidatus Azambacteria bacterium]MBI3685037.1 sigma-70 family RNA polymerase sigma factor [Candidatus Azambacteria bacterium]